MDVEELATAVGEIVFVGGMCPICGGDISADDVTLSKWEVAPFSCDVATGGPIVGAPASSDVAMETVWKTVYISVSTFSALESNSTVAVELIAPSLKELYGVAPGEDFLVV